MKMRWYWWQFWRPRYPRVCKTCMIALFDEGNWLQHQLYHWQQGGSIEARHQRLKEKVSELERHLMPTSKDDLN